MVVCLVVRLFSIWIQAQTEQALHKSGHASSNYLVTLSAQAVLV